VTNEDLQERIQNSPALCALQNQLQSEIGFRAPKEASFNPLLVISAISIIVQIVIHCRENQDEQSVRAAMRDLRSLPRRQQFRLRRALRQLWRENCPAGVDTDENPLLEAVYQLSDSADDAAIDELLWLAEKHNQ
jgi:hypothetical protein